MDTLKGSINILTDKTDPANPIYKTLYPKTRADQVEGFDDRVKDLVGDTITVSGTAGSRKTIIGNLQADAISTSTGAAISATVTNAASATNASKDVNNKDLTEYIGSVSAVSGYNNQINVKTGAQMKAGSAGNTITINNVEKAQKDINGTAITGYIGSIAAGSTANKIVVKTGAQVHDNTAGTEITINNVANATNATNATSATSATSAGKATNDANGNAITGYIHSVALKSGTNNTLVVKTGADYKNNAAGTEVVVNNVANATSATKDSASQTISSTYIKGLSVSGTTLTYTKGDNSTGTVTLPETGITTDTNDKVTNTLNTTAKAYITGTTSATTNTGTQIFDTGVYLSTTAGELVATKFTGALNGNASSATKATQDGSGNTITSTYATKSVATTSANGLMSSTDKSKLDNITDSADAVSFTRSLNSGTKIGTITINGTGTDIYCESAGSANIHYATCTTAAATVAKTVTASGFTLTAGNNIIVKFSNGSTVTGSTLNVNSLGAKNIYYNNAIIDTIPTGSALHLVYDGTQFNVVGHIGSTNLLTKPSAPTGLTYNGSAKTPWSSIDTSTLIIGGTTSGTNATSYTTTFTPKTGNAWSADGSRTTHTVTWSIAKAAGSSTINPTATSYTLVENDTQAVTVTRSGDGVISATSNNTTVATVSSVSSSGVFTITAKSAGTATITVSVAAGTNYTAPANKTITVTVVKPGVGIRYVLAGGHTAHDTANSNWKNIDAAGAIIASF